MRYDLKSGFETFAGAAVAGASRNIVTQHPANPVPKTNWYFDAGAILAGLAVEGLGVATRSRALHEMGEGLLAPGFAYATADATQLIRNKLAAKAAAGSTPAANFVQIGGGGAAPQPSYAGADYGNF